MPDFLSQIQVERVMKSSLEFFEKPTEVKDKYVKLNSYYGYYRPGDKL
jgi:isopenicillin N synthase-like dioxygenase